MEDTKTSIEECEERYMKLYESMMAPWRFEKWKADLAHQWMPEIPIQPVEE